MAGSGFIKVINAKNISITGARQAAGDAATSYKPNGYIIQGGLISADGDRNHHRRPAPATDRRLAATAAGPSSCRRRRHHARRRRQSGVSATASAPSPTWAIATPTAASSTRSRRPATSSSTATSRSPARTAAPAASSICRRHQRRHPEDGRRERRRRRRRRVRPDRRRRHLRQALDRLRQQRRRRRRRLDVVRRRARTRSAASSPAATSRRRRQPPSVSACKAARPIRSAAMAASLDATALGLVLFDNVTRRAPTPRPTSTATAATSTIDSSDIDFYRVEPPLDGDLKIVGGLISMTSGNTGGDGGSFDLDRRSRSADHRRHQRRTASTPAATSTGTAGRAIALGGLIDSTGGAANGAGDGGYVDFESGLGSDEGGARQPERREERARVRRRGERQRTDDHASSGCGLTVAPRVKIDGHAGVSADNIPGGSDIELISRRPMVLGNELAVPREPRAAPSRSSHLPGRIRRSAPTWCSIRRRSITCSRQAVRIVPCAATACGRPARSATRALAADGACCNATCYGLHLCPTATPTPTPTARGRRRRPGPRRRRRRDGDGHPDRDRDSSGRPDRGDRNARVTPTSLVTATATSWRP